MSPKATFATARRVFGQLRRDHRTMGMMILIPMVLLTLIKYVVEDNTFQRVGLPLLGIFPLIVMFIITSIAMLRERSSGTLERLMTLPLGKLDILLGYGLAFAVFATIQALVASGVAIGLLGLDIAGSAVTAIALAVLNAILGMALGLLASAFASTEFQAVQFMPAFILPQLVLCGLFAPRDSMAGVLEATSNALPMTYAFDGLQEVAESSSITSALAVDATVTAGVVVLALTLAAATLRRRTT
jgi:ABC-2 type transport system permease protein